MLLGIGIVQALFIGLLTLSGSNKRASDYTIAIWMLFLALPLLSRLISPEYYDAWIPIISCNLPYGLAFGPLLWFYTQQLTGRNPLKSEYLLHGMPFLLGSCLKALSGPMPIFSPVLEAQKAIHLNGFTICVIISSIGYSAAAFRSLNQHKNDVLGHFSSLSTLITLRWLRWLAIGFLILSLLPIAASLFSLPELMRTRGFALTGFIFVLGFFSLRQTQVFVRSIEGHQISHSEQTVGEPLQLVTSQRVPSTSLELKVDRFSQPEQPRNKYERSSLTDDKAQVFLQRLENYMLAERPYLDTELTIDKLAQQLEIPKHHLTQILSEQLNKNFYLFINEFRVETVKRLMQEPGNDSMTLLAMAHQSGFNSKSTFNKVFKKITGNTPSEYRESASSLNDLEQFNS